jgi:hypothetical protein
LARQVFDGVVGDEEVNNPKFFILTRK